ncbi:MAG: hypothetical protein CTY17_07895 [Methylomonas sp.]|nr:MAG: hypothetical protein CTY23_10065 [Methylomonas sp.]PPD28200.1 MAG: hypothetical protein CTY21_13245 [Methylomonas sp.]PPD39618.1 MAG: hypothetical protein CTY17_07895 [Methylomonas sp.]PPD54448.1 MAG: hypothetical protein CTY11_03885 [Methylomonas sp.]
MNCLPIHPRTANGGFSLIEMAVALVIVGLLLGGLMMPLSLQMDNARRKDTERTQSALLEAVYGHAISNGRLPCPDINNDGMEDRVGGNCVSAFGGLPWASLGTGQNDAWGRGFVYRVTPTFADSTDGTGCTTATPGVSFSLCSTGDIEVRNSAVGQVLASNLAAIVVSQGANAGAAAAADEIENTDNDAIFVSRTQAADFDDLVAWVVPGILLNRMVVTGRLP